MANTIDEMIAGYADWIIMECHNGRIPYYINIMFHPLGGSSINLILSKMQTAIYTHFYPTLCNRFAKHPGRKCQESLLPRLILFFDLPVWKHRQDRSKHQYQPNFGLHLNGFILVRTKSHLKEADFRVHIAQKQHMYVDRIVNGRSVYDRGGVERVHVTPINVDPHRVSDYSFKTVTAGKIDYDSTIILPRSWAEMHPSFPCLDTRLQAIKDIQAATHFSDQLATQIHDLSCRK